jgi:p-aminobenzoyl-glutamate transporter AbgT
MGFNPLIIVAFVTFLGIVISSIILGIANTVSGYLDDTKYIDLVGDCENTKEKIFSIVDDDINRIRWINGIMLAIFIILFILSCVGIYFTWDKDDTDEKTQSSVVKFFKSSFFLYVVLFILFLIFLVYTIFYGIMLGKISGADEDCFGDDSKDNIKLGNFNKAKNLITTQFITCLFMFIVILFIIGGIIFYKARKATKKNE